MNIEEINRKHNFEREFFHQVEKGLSSQLMAYKNTIIYINVEISPHSSMSHHDITLDMAHSWRSMHPELALALGCKVMIRDLRENGFEEEMDSWGGFDSRMGMLFEDGLLN